MNYALLDANGFVLQIFIYSEAQYAVLTPDQQSALISCDPSIAVGYQLTPTGWLTLQQLDQAAFADNPLAYMVKQINVCTAFFQNQLNNIGFQYSNNLWYRADMQAQVWGMGFLMMASSGVLHSAPYIWVDVNNEITTFNTEDEALAFVNYLLEWVAAFLRTFNRIKAQILLATTSDAIDAICLAFVSSQPGVYIAPSS